jgi:hypothetical protein
MTSEPFDPADLEARIAAIRRLADELGKVRLKGSASLTEAERLAESLQEQAAALRSRIRRTR